MDLDSITAELQSALFPSVSISMAEGRRKLIRAALERVREDVAAPFTTEIHNLNIDIREEAHKEGRVSMLNELRASMFQAGLDCEEEPERDAAALDTPEGAALLMEKYGLRKTTDCAPPEGERVYGYVDEDGKVLCLTIPGTPLPYDKEFNGRNWKPYRLAPEPEEKK